MPSPRVLDAQLVAGGGRFRGIRLAATWDAERAFPNHRTNPPRAYSCATISGRGSPISHRAS